MVYKLVKLNKLVKLKISNSTGDCTVTEIKFEATPDEEPPVFRQNVSHCCSQTA